MNAYIPEPITAFAYGPKTIEGVIIPYIRAHPGRKLTYSRMSLDSSRRSLFTRMLRFSEKRRKGMYD